MRWLTQQFGLEWFHHVVLPISSHTCSCTDCTLQFGPFHFHFDVSDICCRYRCGRLICTRHSAKSSSESDEWLGDNTGMDDIWWYGLFAIYVHFSHCFYWQVAAPSADATLLASIVANLSTETVPARGLRVGEVHAIWSNTLCLPFAFVTLVQVWQKYCFSEYFYL